MTASVAANRHGHGQADAAAMYRSFSGNRTQSTAW
jgi:hypothetical protein